MKIKKEQFGKDLCDALEEILDGKIFQMKSDTSTKIKALSWLVHTLVENAVEAENAKEKIEEDMEALKKVIQNIAISKAEEASKKKLFRR